MPAKKTSSAPARTPRRSSRPRAVDWPREQRLVTVPIDLAVYPLPVVYGAAYALMDRAYVLIQGADEGRVDVRLCGKQALDDDGLRALGGDFANELVDQALRETLDESGRKIREYIVAKSHFFHDAGGQDIQALLDATMLEAFDDDPLDIAVPWEEKYGDANEEGDG